MSGSSAGGGTGPSATGASDGGSSEPRGRSRVVISSVTGEPIAWDEPEETPGAGRAPQRRPHFPDRVAEDAPEPGTDESNDARLTGDVPPHWGRGR